MITRGKRTAVTLTAVLAGGLLLAGVGVRAFAQSGSPAIPMQGGGPMMATPAMPMHGAGGGMMGQMMGGMMSDQTVEQMHAQLPAELRAQMDAMHAQLPADVRQAMEQMHPAMSLHMAGGQMPMGTMAGPSAAAQPGDDDHASHHPGPAGRS